ncbi:MAG: Uma2 family endonuclease [Planctomycetota bacterium]|nr:MAG: Uma2 family endonuclease [Planctomycetota bacterium]
MSSVAENLIPRPNVQLIETDGEPLETLWHFMSIVLLIDSVRYHFHPRTDFFVGGNMFIYYSEEQARNRDYRGPDFFYVSDVDGTKERRWWAIWEEGGRYPDMIMELLSRTTAQTDRTTKKRIYERTFHTHEYFCYDPDTQHLEGWRLGETGRYQDIQPNEQGWLRCEEFGLWLGTWTGKYLEHEGTFPRFYDDQGRLVLTFKEAEEQRANMQEQRADVEKQRAEQALAELVRLKAQLGDGKGSNGED